MVEDDGNERSEDGLERHYNSGGGGGGILHAPGLEEEADSRTHYAEVCDAHPRAAGEVLGRLLENERADPAGKRCRRELHG